MVSTVRKRVLFWKDLVLSLSYLNLRHQLFESVLLSCVYVILLDQVPMHAFDGHFMGQQLILIHDIYI